jgi:hypothetical protein
MTSIVPLITGALAAGYAVAALFFLKFWRQTRDRLFACFAAAFAILALQRIALYAVSDTGADTTWLYAARLAAFLLILWAIVDKNRAASPGAGRG